jgi:hypothetical protein
MTHFLSFLKISNAQIPHERWAPVRAGPRLRQIVLIALRPAVGALPFTA